MGERKPTNISAQFITELNALSDAECITKEINEKTFKERKFPLRYNPDIKDKWGTGGTMEWNEEEIRKFYEDPENISRTIYCPKMNVDDIDDWGMFGTTPGFYYLEKINYIGSKTLADKASSLGLSIKTDPKTGLGLLGHSDYFPRYKFDCCKIKATEYIDIFNIMIDIFNKKALEKQTKSPAQLENPST